MDKTKYWLKFYKDFLKTPQMRVIRKMPNGTEYLLLYISLMLESIEFAGHLRFTETIPYNDEMLASITDTNIDIVRSGMTIFEELGMIQILSDKTIFLPDVPKLTGKESESAARVRKWRLKHKENLKLLQCNDDVTTCNGDVQNSNDNIEEEIEIDKEIDIDIDIDNLYSYLEENYGRTICQIEYNKLNEFVKCFELEVIKRAIKISVFNNVKNIAYLEGILNNWKAKGITKLSDFPKNEKSRDDPTEDISNELLEYDWLNDEGVDEDASYQSKT